MTKTLPEPDEPAKGAWFIFGRDMGVYPLDLHTDELEARRLADKIGYHCEIVFWPNGTPWDEVDS